MRNIRHKFRAAVQTARLECFLLAGVAVGALTVAADANLWTRLTVAGGAFLAAALFCDARRFGVFTLGCAAAFGSGMLRATPGADHYSAFIPASRVVETVVDGRISDSNFSRADGLENPAFFALDVHRLQLPGEPPRNAGGRLFVRLTRRVAPDKNEFHHGALVRLSGRLTPAGRNTVVFVEPTGERRRYGRAGLQDFDDYLNARGGGGILLAGTAEFLGDAPDWETALLTVRDKLMNLVNRDIADPEVRNLVDAMFFGCKQGLSAADRRDFVLGGTVHLFSVSGMHVAVLAGLLLLLLRPLPFNWRHWLLAVILGLYVISTGAGAPAVRAFLMIGTWCVLRAGVRFIPTTAILEWTCAALLIWNPFQIFDVGFLFSFLITGALLLLADHEREWCELFPRRPLYGVGTPLPNPARKAARILLRAIAACTTAFLAGCAVSMAAFGLFLPAGILANLLILFPVALLFQVVLLKLLLGFLPGVNPVLGWCIEQLFGFIRLIVEGCGTLFERADPARVPLWITVPFTVGLFVLLAARGRVGRIAGLGLAGVSLAGGLFYQLPRTPELLVFSGDGPETLALVFADGAAQYAAAVNTPPYEAAGEVRSFLSRNGLARLDLLVFPDSGADGSRSLSKLMTDCSPRRIVVLKSGGTTGKKLRELLPETDAITESRTDGCYNDALTEILTGKGFWTFAYCNRATNSKWFLRFQGTPAESRVEVRGNGRESVFEPEASNLTEIRYFGNER